VGPLYIVTTPPNEVKQAPRAEKDKRKNKTTDMCNRNWSRRALWCKVGSADKSAATVTATATATEQQQQQGYVTAAQLKRCFCD